MLGLSAKYLCQVPSIFALGISLCVASTLANDPLPLSRDSNNHQASDTIKEVEGITDELDRAWKTLINELIVYLTGEGSIDKLLSTSDMSSLMTARGKRAFSVYFSRGFGKLSQYCERSLTSLHGVRSYASWIVSPQSSTATLRSSRLLWSPTIEFIRSPEGVWKLDLITRDPRADVIDCYYNIAQMLYINGLDNASELVAQYLVDAWRARDEAVPGKYLSYFESWSHSEVFLLARPLSDQAVLIEFARSGEVYYYFRMRNGGWFLTSIEYGN